MCRYISPKKNENFEKIRCLFDITFHDKILLLSFVYYQSCRYQIKPTVKKYFVIRDIHMF